MHIYVHHKRVVYTYYIYIYLRLEYTAYIYTRKKI